MPNLMLSAQLSGTSGDRSKPRMHPPPPSLRRDPAAAGRNKDEPQMNADLRR
jgi:hypothetical protein